MKPFDRKLNDAVRRFVATEYALDTPHDYAPETTERLEELFGEASDKNNDNNRIPRRNGMKNRPFFKRFAAAACALLVLSSVVVYAASP
ncbi:MAG: hypothetical protein ACI4V1_06955, partial [Eubacteriales bacterium]